MQGGFGERFAEGKDSFIIRTTFKGFLANLYDYIYKLVKGRWKFVLDSSKLLLSIT